MLSIILINSRTIYELIFISSHTHLRYQQISPQSPIDMSNIVDYRHLLTDCNILNEWMLADMQHSAMYQGVLYR